ncbi:MAG TPA: hypothetical protein PL012_07860 [Candidatus Obscuribacter sp.]|nr:hypothetical protein [Candidatus Obscuribacter sp.]
MKFDFVSGLKKGIEAIKIVKTILRAVDKIDDDLDGDGKSQLVNIGESLNELAHLVVNSGKEIFRLSLDNFAAVKLQAVEVFGLCHALAEHVLKEDKEAKK